MKIDSLKKSAMDYIEELRNDLCDISVEIHSHPEVAYQEVRASSLLTEYLEKNNFSVEKRIGGVETAFRTSFSLKENGVRIAFLAEYDALPGIGHACGHNLIAAGAIGAFMAVAKVLKESYLAGKIMIIGTPAEEYTEGKEGKIVLLESGVFDWIDACLMFHPWTYSRNIKNNLAFAVLHASFRGKASHASIDPWDGLNALDAAVMTYNGVSVLRQQLRSEGRISIIITEGGSAVNMIPDKASVRIALRSPSMPHLNELVSILTRCIEGAAISTGTKAHIQLVTTVYNIRFNAPLLDIVTKNFELLGINPGEPEQSTGSTDFGNLSQHIPGINFYVKTHEPGTPWHSIGTKDQSTNELAHDGMIIGAKNLAMSAIDIMAKPELLEDIKEYFSQQNNG